MKTDTLSIETYTYLKATIDLMLKSMTFNYTELPMWRGMVVVAFVSGAEDRGFESSPGCNEHLHPSY
jgi:hypothetical protein